ncbi:hypothetical protein [Streptomyces sp. NPDC048650]|uniref:hypothetical protein n=1 Tax=unclassified Streptomyces TaxID=2593676 RepID=UPI003717D65F
MFSRKKIAAVSGLLGGLAMMTCVGATEANAGGHAGGCRQSHLGNTVCIHKSDTVYKSKNGMYVIKQKRDCSAATRQRVVWPEAGLLNNGSTRIGPVVNCSNRAHLPKGFKPPRIKF